MWPWPHSTFNTQHSTFSWTGGGVSLWMKYLVWPLVKFLVAFIIVQVIVAAMNWIERRLLGLVQARMGPNRVGNEVFEKITPRILHPYIPGGLLQILADPIKFLLKEDI